METFFNDILSGYSKFRKNYFENPDCQLFKNLNQSGQRPKAIVIACSDSRVDPALLLDTQPGDLFVVRNVANLVPPCEIDHSHHGTSAALEFAVCALEVPHIIILGHSNCGGISALVQGQAGPSEEGFIGQWMALAKPALDKMLSNNDVHHYTLTEKVACCAKHALVDSYHHLYTFPWIKERVEAGKLKLHAWFFQLEDGVIKSYNTENKLFEDLLKP
jgi:carbonic anhydrase